MNKQVKIILIIALFGLLILVRIFEDRLFYDPLLEFFKTDHSTEPLPALNTLKTLFHVAIRFGANTLISLLVLWVAFRDRGVLKLSILLYGILFIVGMILYTSLLSQSNAGDHMLLFYVRRFLIQPLFLLLLLPAFYFHKRGT